MKSTKICVVGTVKTGSTRLFNLVRMIYEKKGKTVNSEWNIKPEEIEEMSKKYDVILSKVHNIDHDYLNNYDLTLLPIRNILDSAISAGVRKKNTSTEFYLKYCNYNIKLFNKFKPNADFIFKYESYDVHYIKKLCTTLNINLDNNEIVDIMKQLEDMLNSKDIVENDDKEDEYYKKTLFCKDHNTSDGKINKFINLPSEQLNDILKEKNICTFLEENFYF